MTKFNQRDYLLIRLMEECNEVSQRAAKALQYGIHEKQKDQPLDNNQRLAQEFTDLVAVSEMLNDHLTLRLRTDDESAKLKKKEKVLKYMEYSKTLGVL